MTSSEEHAAGTEGKGSRFSSRRKTAVILCLLRGEELDILSRELGVTAATLAQWRDRFVQAGQAALKSRRADGRDEEVRRLQATLSNGSGSTN